jgi:hypothetical protein
VEIGDFASTRVPGTFSLVYLVFNTIMNLTTQDAQVACFRNAAAHLAPGGRFVIEVGVPQLRRLPPGDTAHAFALTPTHLGVDEYDPVTQRLVSHHHVLRAGLWESESLPYRYVWPSELDLMARLAGMTLEHRWATWTESRSPPTATLMCRCGGGQPDYQKAGAGISKAPSHSDSRRENHVITLGIILLIIGFVAKVAVLWSIGILVLVVGAILAVLGMMGRAVGGRAHYF